MMLERLRGWRGYTDIEDTLMARPHGSHAYAKPMNTRFILAIFTRHDLNVHGFMIFSDGTT